MARTTLVSGPWKQVRNTTDPFDDPPEMLQDATNIYLPDPANGCGAYQRPAFLWFTSQQVPVGSSWRPNGVTVRTSSGAVYNFMAAGGKIYRCTTDFTTVGAQDVTPVGPTIDASPFTRIALYAYADSLIVSDGVNRPWVGTNLGGSPITGTNIDIDGLGTAWTAYGPPTQYSGVLVWIANTVPAGSAVRQRVGIVWCEPNQPLVGYVQSGYTDFANIVQTSSKPLTAVWGTNNALIYWRDSEIGSATGIVDGSFSSTYTSSSISRNVGLLSPWTLGQYADTIYFCDQYGRPQKLDIGAPLGEDQMWLQLRQNIESQTQAASYQNALFSCAVGVVEPNLNLYLCAPYSSSATNSYPPNTMYAFDAKTGRYIGIWNIGATGTVAISGLWTFADYYTGSDSVTLVTNEFAGGAYSSAAWLMWLRKLSDAQWIDSVSTQVVNVTTGRLGYSADILHMLGETATAITMNASSVALKIQTPYTTSTTVGTISPATSYDSTYRVVWGMDSGSVREVRCTLTPTLTTTQWGIQQLQVVSVPSLAGREEA